MLDGKRLIVAGGTTGLGLSAAMAFACEGARLVVFGRSTESVSLAQDHLGNAGHAFAADATAPETTERAIADCVTRWGGFDGLYHVAGGSGRRYGDGPLHEMPDEGWTRTLELNLTSVAWSNRAAIRHWLAHRQGGSLLNVSSVLGFSPSPRHFTTHAYAAAKAAIIGLSRSLAASYATCNIRVNVLAPALIETPMSRRAAEDVMIRRFIATKQPLDGGRIGMPEDANGAAVFLLSDAARFVTGQVLAVDGGWCVSEGQAEAASAPNGIDEGPGRNLSAP
jgi:NAD(P)-dependent dehydrogenase (short-subunit alcohol dehydrogenase family)